MDMAENVKERYELAKERILEVLEEDGVRGEYGIYFRKTAAFVGEMTDAYDYVDSGKLVTDRETGKRFQRDLEEMCRLLKEKIPDVGIYIFDTPVSGKGMETWVEQGLTMHCIGLARAAEQQRTEGKTVVEWVWSAVNGKTECIGLKLLKKA